MTCIVLPQPGSHLVAEVPRRVVPDQQHRGEPLRRSRRAAPGEQGGGLGADRAACPTAQQHWFGLGGDVTHHQAIAGQRLRLRISVGPRFFSQAHGRLVRRPGLQRRLRQATPPDCITKAQSPRWMGDGERHPSSVMLGSKGSPCWNTFAWSVAGRGGHNSHPPRLSSSPRHVLCCLICYISWRHDREERYLFSYTERTEHG